MNDLRYTPLHERHLQLGARMVPFGGWSMPVQYSGILEEHLHTRTQAGLFDICHMGEFYLEGPGAVCDVDRLATCRIDNLEVGRCRYGFFLREDGTVIDDLITFRTREEQFFLVVNAATTEKDADWIRSHIGPGTTFRDVSAETAKIDLQGPASGEILSRILGRDPIEAIGRFRFAEATIEGVETLLSRTGYTGERGYELFYPTEQAELLWDLLLSFDEAKPVGLGARDTLRLEAGLSLYGHELSDSRTPVEAGLERFVCFDKDFIGKEALLKQKENGAKEVLTGFLCEGRRAAREGFSIAVDGKTVGEVTSGAFSPSLKRGIGMGYVARECAQEGREVVLEKGRTSIKAEVKSIPVWRK